MQPHQVGFWRRFGLKTGLIYFAYFGLESGMVFEGTTGAYERIYFQMNKNEVEQWQNTACEFEMHSKNFFCLRTESK